MLALTFMAVVVVVVMVMVVGVVLGAKVAEPAGTWRRETPSWRPPRRPP